MRKNWKKAKKDDLDRNVVHLVRILNSFPGIQTIGSCGGHPNPDPCQWSEGSFYVKFHVAWNAEGRLSLEFLAWLINDMVVRTTTKGNVLLLPVSPPPYLNDPGNCLCFVIEGSNGADPEELAETMDEAKTKCFVQSEDDGNACG